MADFIRPPDPPDPDAFDALVRQWWPFCERWATYHERRTPGADLGPAANLALWRAAATFDPARGVPFVAWLKLDLRNHRTAPIRAAGRHRRRDALREPPEPPREPSGPDLEDLTATLPAIHRERLRLRYAEDLTYREVARREGVSAMAVFYAERRALASLRLAL